MIVASSLSVSVIRISCFEFVSDFGFRFSCFSFDCGFASKNDSQNRAASFSEICRPMFSDAVAAGDGALQTLMTRPDS